MKAIFTCTTTKSAGRSVAKRGRERGGRSSSWIFPGTSRTLPSEPVPQACSSKPVSSRPVSSDPVSPTRRALPSRPIEQPRHAQEGREAQRRRQRLATEGEDLRQPLDRGPVGRAQEGGGEPHDRAPGHEPGAV